MHRSLKQLFHYYNGLYLFYKENFLNYRLLFIRMCLFDFIHYVFSKKFALCFGLTKSKVILKNKKQIITENLQIFTEMWKDQPYVKEKGFKLKKKDIVVDVGALDGDFATFCSIKGAIVYSFDANPRVFPFLSINAETIGNIYPSCFIVSNKTGFGVMYENEPGHSRFNMTRRGRREGIAFKVAETTLDSQLNLNRIDLLKLDVEGSELMVFKGATETLKKTKKIALEVHDGLLRECTSFLEKRGFECFSKLVDNHTPFLFAINKNLK
jgi:FkbM family methyltransferase